MVLESLVVVTVGLRAYYTEWENIKDKYMYQRMIADIVGDYFFICPSIQFAQIWADRGLNVYYYFFTQVRRRPCAPFLVQMHDY
uniref:Carboxylesterase type B domain-containing protein n=1 Tax=Trichogramma kaykai TaxID=54128 RepID=A0ABD2WDR1_9HYME